MYVCIRSTPARYLDTYPLSTYLPATLTLKTRPLGHPPSLSAPTPPGLNPVPLLSHHDTRPPSPPPLAPARLLSSSSFNTIRRFSPSLLILLPYITAPSPSSSLSTSPAPIASRPPVTPVIVDSLSPSSSLALLPRLRGAHNSSCALFRPNSARLCSIASLALRRPRRVHDKRNE